jgi:hypothetical protein
MTELENKIREALPRLKRIEVGQKFLSKYYGIITATYIYNLEGNKFEIYGFDEVGGLPRRCNYPRDLELVGHPIKLNDVLEWLCLNKNYSCNMQDGNFYIFGISWDLSSVFLADQSEELKEFLNSL